MEYVPLTWSSPFANPSLLGAPSYCLISHLFFKYLHKNRICCLVILLILSEEVDFTGSIVTEVTTEYNLSWFTKVIYIDSVHNSRVWL